MSLHGQLALADAASAANTFIDTFLWVYILLLFVYVLMSWVRLPYTVWVRRVDDFLRGVWVARLRVFRRGLPPLGPPALSPRGGLVAAVGRVGGGGALLFPHSPGGRARP